MAREVIMPKEGITVESCLIGKWHKELGDAVAEYEALFDYETDKAAFECVSTAAGVLLHKYYEDGDEAPVLAPVAIIGEAGEDISALIAGGGQTTAAPAAESGIQAAGEQAAAAHGGDTQALKASPRARGDAALQGVDLLQTAPSGPGGRILEADVIAASAAVYEAEAETQGADGNPPENRLPEPPRNDGTAAGARNAAAAPEYIDEPFTKIRSVIAKSMTASLQRSAQLTHHHSFDATMLLAMRGDFKTSDEAYGYRGVSVGDIILYVVSRALANHPEINALVSADGMRKYNTVNLGVAVDTPRGLMVPTVFAAEKKSLRGISAEVRLLAAAAREGRISPDKLTGGTFTVSNLGATGVESFTPIINPPQVAILGVCGVTGRVRKGRGGRPDAYSSIGISLTYDHRAIDGAPASRFAAELCGALEDFSWKTLALEN
ncbi:MAG: 2-oxo acid dehydrogenase subunit E2 [Clostridiales Family XIII bacterium]|jgi:pyruvate dehydrogenase E2 component (dihydrolipoamide acetyltransferase)|nr:2-oxo acid dehydrogenase subunit E2 [Clostridiales Family XIII bacterium]